MHGYMLASIRVAGLLADSCGLPTEVVHQGNLVHDIEMASATAFDLL